MKRHANKGLRKLCDCARRTWAKCPHSWYLNFKPKGGPSYRLSLDKEAGKHLESKTDADTEAERIRREIRAGTFRRPAPVVTTPDALSFDAFGEKWVKGAASVSGKTSWKDDTYVLARIGAWTPEGAERFGLKAIGMITEDDFEALRVHLRTIRRAANTWNHYLQVLKSLSRWGVKKGYLTRSWFGADSDLKRERPGRRSRRLAPGEEAALLKAANPQLQRLIIAALETGCRLGELLSLQWADVSLERGVLCGRAENAKDREARELPISTRLRAVLEMNRNDPAGEPFAGDRFPFGDAVGRQVGGISTAWENTVLRAHGVRPQRGAGGRLPADVRALYRGFDLHFHDLRHEAGSRLLEAGWPVHHVSEMLGHADLSTTSTYLNITRMGLQESMKRFDKPADATGADVPAGGDNPPGCNSVAKTERREHRFSGNGESEAAGKPLVN
jgi:integrase